MMKYDTGKTSFASGTPFLCTISASYVVYPFGMQEENVYHRLFVAYEYTGSTVPSFISWAPSWLQKVTVAQ